MKNNTVLSLSLSVSVFLAFELTFITQTNKQQTPWPESVSEPYRLSDRCLSAMVVPTFADRGCHVVSVTDPYGRILAFETVAITVFSK
jgi:hypothetical protein